MNELLEVAVRAHGGLDRWSQLKNLKSNMSITGTLWQVKSRPDVLKEIRMEAELRRQQLTTYRVGEDKRFAWKPNSVAIETVDGHVLSRFDDPRTAFKGQVLETPWEDVHVTYFSSEAMWTYLTIPFLYTYPGFAVEMLPTWHEDGEEWRPLKATFPDSFTSHTREQISYFGKDGLLRRHEYTVDILGGAQGVNYAYDYRDFDGIMVPTKRRVFAYDAAKRKIPGLPLVAIDIKDVAFS
jgi:hypothetical protein